MKRGEAALRRLGLLALQGLCLLVRVSPLSLSLAVGRRLGDLARIVSPRRRAVALKNLKIAFGDELTESARRRIVQAAFRHFGMFVVESMAFAYEPSDRLTRRLTVDPRIDAAIDRAMEARRGCIIVTAHLGCFELPGRHFAARGHRVIVVSRAARDEGTTKLMTALRERQGLQVVVARGAPKALFDGLRRNAIVGIVCDQNSEDTRLPFFGHPAGTATGPARIARRTRSPIVVIVCPRDGHGRYRAEYVGEIDPTPSEDEEADIARIMTEVNRLIETAVRKHPEQWLWFHDRWRAPRQSAAPQPSAPLREGE